MMNLIKDKKKGFVIEVILNLRTLCKDCGSYGRLKSILKLFCFILSITYDANQKFASRYHTYSNIWYQAAHTLSLFVHKLI